MQRAKYVRSSGVLLHPTSLPGKGGIGTLGAEAGKFIAFLKAAGQKYWQTLPLGPTGYGDSPYQCFSAFAGNPYLIDLDELESWGLLKAAETVYEETDPSRVDFGRLYGWKWALLRKAFSRFQASAGPKRKAELAAFEKTAAFWLPDYALFMALKHSQGGKSWNEWEHGLKFREKTALELARKELSGEIGFHIFTQYVFFHQWNALKREANASGIRIIGDVPIFVAFDSADAWSRPEEFQFDPDLAPKGVAGVPPDYFSATGQLWGNPLYDWPKMKKEGYSWWVERFRSALGLFDVIRIDHFRGFAGYWRVPYGAENAIGGRWMKGPGTSLFAAAEAALGTLPILAEDLGFLTPDVEKLRDRLGYPGMKILQFAFDSDAKNAYLPMNFIRHCVVYTGTHDNDTTEGWYSGLSEAVCQRVDEYVRPVTQKMSWELVSTAWLSTACIAVTPMQDLLGLSSEARMNFPGKPSGNWQWRMSEGAASSALAEKLLALTRLAGRERQ